MSWVTELFSIFLDTLQDVLPIASILIFFQFAILRKPLPNTRKLLTGFGCVLLGLILFLMGLEKALFPIGRLMAEQFAAPEFVGAMPGEPVIWYNYGWVYAFAFAIGFSLPLAALALGASFGKAALKAKRAEAVIRVAAGLLLIGVGFYFLCTF